ncbi:UDP-glucose 4-epimerase [Minicystis rosea]|nr:UDP-glucose 4-epimerase [Minicystis rosea]
MKILVTGALGFIGGSVARYARDHGHEVIGTARTAAPAAGLPIVAATDEPALAAIVEEHAPDVILHAAGRASVAASLSAPRDDFEGSVLSWHALLEAVRRSGRRPLVILPSSAAVYGNPEHLPVAEDAPAAPISPYGFHKRLCEILADEYARCFGIEVVITRLFSVLGPAQRRLLVWEIFAQLQGPEEVAWLQGTGRETRDFLHVDDVAEAMLRIAAAPRRPGAEVLNLASGEERSVLDLATALRDRVAPEKRIACRGEARPGDPQRWCADVTRLHERVAPFRPRTFDEALDAVVAAWRETRAT